MSLNSSPDLPRPTSSNNAAAAAVAAVTAIAELSGSGSVKEVAPATGAVCVAPVAVTTVTALSVLDCREGVENDDVGSCAGLGPPSSLSSFRSPQHLGNSGDDDSGDGDDDDEDNDDDESDDDSDADDGEGDDDDSASIAYAAAIMNSMARARTGGGERGSQESDTATTESDDSSGAVCRPNGSDDSSMGELRPHHTTVTPPRPSPKTAAVRIATHGSSEDCCRNPESETSTGWMTQCEVVRDDAGCSVVAVTPVRVPSAAAVTKERRQSRYRREGGRGGRGDGGILTGQEGTNEECLPPPAAPLPVECDDILFGSDLAGRNGKGMPPTVSAGVCASSTFLGGSSITAKGGGRCSNRD